jgi:hypothetical protein
MNRHLRTAASLLEVSMAPLKGWKGAWPKMVRALDKAKLVQSIPHSAGLEFDLLFKKGVTLADIETAVKEAGGRWRTQVGGDVLAGVGVGESQAGEVKKSSNSPGHLVMTVF